MSIVTVNKFGNSVGVSDAVQQYVTAAIAEATGPLIENAGPSIPNGIPQYIDTQGKVVKTTPYSMPTTQGNEGEVLQVDASGNIVYGAGGPPVIPTYLPTLTVTNLSQGPSNLVQNYTLPDYPPLSNSVLASSNTITMSFNGTGTIRFTVSTIRNGVVGFFVAIRIGIYPISDILLALEEGVRTQFNGLNVIAEVLFGYDEITNRFSIRLSSAIVPSNFVFLNWDSYNGASNNNNLFGIGASPLVLNAPPPAAQLVVCPNAPIGVALDTKCIWRDLGSVPVSSIQSTDGTSSIQCDEVSIGQSGIISYGDYNVNNGSINNCGNINALDNCNITTTTTQIVNGLSEIKLNVDSKDRIVINNNDTKLYTKNALTGPTGSLLTLNNDNTFSIGTYFAGNGVIDCQTNSMAIIGAEAKSAFTLTNSTITTTLFNGFLRVDREIIDATSQVFRDGNQVERLKIDNSDVTINNLYSLPSTAGSANQVLTRTGPTSTTWASVSSLTAGVTITFGGSVSIVNNFFRYDATYLAVVSSTPDQVGNVFVSPVALAGVSLSWDTTSGNNTTTLAIYKNNVSTGNIVLTGIRGVIASLPISFAVGDTCQLRYMAGASPGNSQVTLYFT